MARKDVDGIIYTTDAEHEGELIFWLVYVFYGCKKLVQGSGYLLWKKMRVRREAETAASKPMLFYYVVIALNGFVAISHRLPDYAFPLEWRNIVGTLGFQFFISGPSEEDVFRGKAT